MKPDRLPALFSLALIPLARIPFLGAHVFQARAVLFVLCLLPWFFYHDFRKSLFAANSFRLIFLFLTAVLAMNFFFTDYAALWFRVTLIHILVFGYFYFYLDVTEDRHFLKNAMYFFIAVSAGIGALAVFQYTALFYKLDLGPLQRFILPEIFRQQVRYQTFEGVFLLAYRSIGTFFHPNSLALYLSTAYPLCLAIALKSNRRMLRTLLFLALILIFAALVTANSRGAFLNILTSTLIVLVFFWNRVSKAALLLICLAGALFALFIYLKNPFYYRLDQPLSYRDIIWENAWRLFTERPFTGFGAGSFSEYYYSRFGFPSINDLYALLPQIVLIGDLQSLTTFHAHNIFLHYGVEMGIFGALAVLLFYGIILQWIAILWKGREYLKGFTGATAVGGLATFCGNLAHGFFEGMTLFYDLSIGLALIFVLAASLQSIRHIEALQKDKRARRP